MTKFNTTGRRAATGQGPLTVAADQPTPTHQGGPGYTRDPKSDLLLLATTFLDLTGNTFYETGDARVARFRALVQDIAVSDPAWLYQFLRWLRLRGNIRTAAIVGAVDAANALVKAGIPGGRQFLANILTRPDEPGEALAYHMQQYGRTLPKAVKRGLADAAVRLYTERSLLKYDTASHGVRFGDVLDLTHPSVPADKAWQRDLFTYALNRRHGREDMVPTLLDTITSNRLWRDSVKADLTGAELANTIAPETLRRAGLTWEDVLSALGSKVDKRKLWTALIPNMGFMAQLRNLRNFDDAGLTDAEVAPVMIRLANPDEVRRSRQLPLRFLSAYRAAGANLRWAYPLEQALNTATENIPELRSRTLILIDTSGSMNDTMSDRSGLVRWHAAATFGLALARRCEAVDVVSYSNAYEGMAPSKVFPTNRHESLLKALERFQTGGYMLNGGTDTAGALKRHYDGHDRVVILTDEQDGGRGWRWGVGMARTSEAVTDQMPKDRPLYTWNLAGYATSNVATDRNRITLGGLTDAMFNLIPTVEASRPGNWPWTGDPDIGEFVVQRQPSAGVTRAPVSIPTMTPAEAETALRDAIAALTVELGHAPNAAEVHTVFPYRSRTWIVAKMTARSMQS